MTVIRARVPKSRRAVRAASSPAKLPPRMRRRVVATPRAIVPRPGALMPSCFYAMTGVAPGLGYGPAGQARREGPLAAGELGARRQGGRTWGGKVSYQERGLGRRGGGPWLRAPAGGRGRGSWERGR